MVGVRTERIVPRYKILIKRESKVGIKRRRDEKGGRHQESVFKMIVLVVR